MKKKILSLALVIALIAIMVSGTLAYFTAEDEVTNTFTVGSVKIEVYENGNLTEEDTMKFGSLTPVVNTENPSQDVSYIKKAVKVENTGVNAAYIRVYIAVPYALADAYLRLDIEDEGWSSPVRSEATVGGVQYEVIAYTYNTAVANGEFTPELLKGVYLASDVDLLEDGNGNLEFIRRVGDYIDHSGFIAHTLKADGNYTSNPVNVLVAAQAIQAQGFADANTALNTGFPTHPWAN